MAALHAVAMGAPVTDDRDWTVRPGEILREWMEEIGLSVRATAISCARMPVERLERILDGRRRITKDDAMRLQVGTGIPAGLWVKMEARYRADLAAGRKDYD
jgi:addiction module HigA family antidote